jgi:hypothetical protein
LEKIETLNIARTVFAFPGIALDHLITGFKAGISHIRNRILLVVSLFRRNNGGESCQREMYAREAAWSNNDLHVDIVEDNGYLRHQVGLELVQVNV